MRRSVMINKIELVMYNYGLEDDDSQRTSNALLEMLEESGMLPPEVSPIPQDIIDNCESANFWEPEDE